MPSTRNFKIGLDWWSVIAAISAIALIKTGVVTHVPW